MKLASLNEDLTFWGAPTPDGYGGKSFAAPVATKGRWVLKRSLVKTDSGEEVMSTGAALMLARPEVGGYLYQGESASADPYTVDGAREILTVEEGRRLDGKTLFYKVAFR